MDKRIENTMNELIDTEIWSTSLYLSLQAYFEEERLPILGFWLNSQARENMGRAHKLMERIFHQGGSVVIREMKRDANRWQMPYEALNELLDHERCVSRQIATFLFLCRNIDMPSYTFVNHLYADRVYVSSVFAELVRTLSQEYRRRIPPFL